MAWVAIPAKINFRLSLNVAVICGEIDRIVTVVAIRPLLTASVAN